MYSSTMRPPTNTANRARKTMAAGSKVSLRPTAELSRSDPGHRKEGIPCAAKLEGDGFAPIPNGLTPHSLRRTFASILYALGKDPAYVMDQLGHSDPKLALRIYARAMRREPGEGKRLSGLAGLTHEAVVDGSDRVLVRPAKSVVANE
jgi:integrase